MDVEGQGDRRGSRALGKKPSMQQRLLEIVELASLPDWGALFQEGARALRLVVGGAGQAEERGFELQSGLDRQVVAALHGTQTASDSERRLLRDRACQRLRARHQRLRRYHLVDQ